MARTLDHGFLLSEREAETTARGLRLAAERYRSFAADPDPRTEQRISRQFIRQAEEAEALAEKIEKAIDGE